MQSSQDVEKYDKGNQHKRRARNKKRDKRRSEDSEREEVIC
jgi:hypothetical protein